MMFHLKNGPGRTAIVDEKEYLFFSGYSYLGMQHVPEFIELVREGMDKYGSLFPSSRVSNTQLDLFNEFEQRLLEITGMESAVCFSSGFMAGRAVMNVLKDETHSCAPNTHPAICIQKSNYHHFNQWKENLQDAAVVCFDSLNPLTAEINDASFLKDMNRDITCVIDDSHGAGLLNNGAGVSRSLVSNHYVDYVVSFSLSKSYGIPGGVACCSTHIADQLRLSPEYTASTSISPAFAYAFLNGQHLYDQQRKKLQLNISAFNRLTHNMFLSGPQLPVFVIPGSVDPEILAKHNIIISSFAYPDPSGKRINRIVLNALHTEDDLQILSNAITLFH
jgi:8-amino-7-oxononanoate synthase